MGLFSSLGKIAGFIPGVGPLAAAGLGLAGGLIDGKRAGSSAQKNANNQNQFNAEQSQLAHDRQRELMAYQKELNEIDLGKLSKEARENGFNPMTVLGTTGGNGFSGGASLGSPPHQNTLASGDFLTEAMDRSVDNWYNSEPLFNTSEEDGLRVKMMQEELKDLQRRNEAPIGGFGYSIPQVTTTSANTSAANAELSMEQAEKVQREDISLTGDFRTGVQGDNSYTGLNPEAWEIGIGEIAGGALIHGGSFALNKSKQLRDWMKGRYDKGKFPYALPEIAEPFKKKKGDKSRFRQ